MAVIKESLRLSTPVPGITPRVVPPSGATVQGYFIPGGVSEKYASKESIY